MMDIAVNDRISFRCRLLSWNRLLLPNAHSGQPCSDLVLGINWRLNRITGQSVCRRAVLSAVLCWIVAALHNIAHAFQLRPKGFERERRCDGAVNIPPHQITNRCLTGLLGVPFGIVFAMFARLNDG